MKIGILTFALSLAMAASACSHSKTAKPAGPEAGLDEQSTTPGGPEAGLDKQSTTPGGPEAKLDKQSTTPGGPEASFDKQSTTPGGPDLPGSRSTPDQVSLESGTQREGGDYKDFDLEAARPELCQAACAREAKCKSYTYVKPGEQGKSARCWLKAEVPSANKADCCVSGVKRG